MLAFSSVVRFLLYSLPFNCAFSLLTPLPLLYFASRVLRPLCPFVKLITYQKRGSVSCIGSAGGLFLGALVSLEFFTFFFFLLTLLCFFFQPLHVVSDDEQK